MAKNPKLFREMNQPFANRQAAMDAASEFFEALGEVRKQHKISNVVCIANFSYEAEDGEESECVIPIHYGDSMKCETLSAYAFGFYSEQRKSQLSRIIADAKKAGQEDA